jgi:hypothetical protein
VSNKGTVNNIALRRRKILLSQNIKRDYVRVKEEYKTALKESVPVLIRKFVLRFSITTYTTFTGARRQVNSSDTELSFLLQSLDTRNISIIIYETSTTIFSFIACNKFCK